MELIKNILGMSNNLNSYDEDGNNIIHKLVENNDSKILKESLDILIEKGELNKLINQKNFQGYTPLHCAISNHNQGCAQLLVNNGADTNIITNDGQKIKWIDHKHQQSGGNIKNKITGKRYL